MVSIIVKGPNLLDKVMNDAQVLKTTKIDSKTTKPVHICTLIKKKSSFSDFLFVNGFLHFSEFLSTPIEWVPMTWS